MTLELHDNETGNTLRGCIRNIDYDYQAEQWVKDTHDDLDVVQWILNDDVGIRCVWSRDVGSNQLPNISKRSSRFQGTWQKGPQEVAI